MRIPHRNDLSLSVRFVALTILTTFAVLLPICAHAATPELTCLPAWLSFADVPINQSQTQLLVLRNSGATSVTISGITASPSNFNVTGITLPLVLAAGQSAGIQVTFSPTASKWVRGLITLTSNATNSAMQISVQGGGVFNGQLEAQPGSVAFGQVAVGSSLSQSVVLTSSASRTETVRGFEVSGTGFSVSGPETPLVLSAGSRFAVTAKFSPQAAGLASGNIRILSTAGAGLNIPLTASGATAAATGQLAVSPSPLSLGSVMVGSSGTASGSLSASGASVTVTADNINNSAFTVSGLTLPVTIPAGQSVPFTVKFTPTAAGSASATLAFTSNAQTSTTSESLTGTAAPGQLAMSPSALIFGDVNVGTTATQATTLAARGASVTISSAAMSNSLFTLSGASFPMTLSAGQSQQIYVLFSPSASGTDSGTLTLNSNASNIKISESLSGVGVTPQYSVSLSWNASTSSVMGYNIYRGTSPAAYSRINITVDPNTTYTDGTVTAGATYYYTATAVNSSGQESAYSTPIQVTIP